MKRFITILLTCCIVMYMLPLSVFALEAAEPIEISSCEDFNNIRNNLNGDYILAQNLDFSTWGNWEPIGQKEVPFTGTFDGNGYVISNLTIELDKNSAENEADYFASVFGYVSGGEIINFGVNNTSIKLNYDGSYYSNEEEILANAGGIVGLIKDGTISNCFFTGDVVVSATGNAFARAGGIAAAGINSTISNCYSNAQIYATAEYANTMVAGIVAWLDGTNVSNCYAAGTVEGLNENGYCYAGGIHSSANTSSIWGIIISYGGTVSNCAVLLNEIKADGTTNIVEDIGYASEQYNNIRIASNSAEAWEQSTYESLGWDFDSIWYMQNKQYPLLFIFNGNFNLDPDSFNELLYRADFLTFGIHSIYSYEPFNNSVLQNEYSVSSVLVDALGWGMHTLSFAWEAITEAMDTAQSGLSNLTDLALEQKDLMGAYILQALKISTEIGIIDEYKTATKDISEILGLSTDIIKNYTEQTEDFSTFAKKNEGKFKDTMLQYYKDKDPQVADLIASDKGMGILNAVLNTADGIESLYEQYIGYIELYNLTESTKNAVNHMYESCPSSKWDIKQALAEILPVINAATDQQFQNIMTGNLIISAEYSAVKLVVDKWWDGIIKNLVTKYPVMAMVFAIYNAGEYAIDQLFGTDATVEQYYKLRAIMELEDVANTSVAAIAQKYKNNTSELSASTLLDMIEIKFGLLDLDFDEAIKYSEIVHDEGAIRSFVNSIKDLIGADTSNELKDTIEAFAETKDRLHFQMLTNWIYNLYIDYPSLLPNFREFWAEMWIRYIGNDNVYYLDGMFTDEELQAGLDKLIEIAKDLFEHISVACPVNVYVYDSANNLVASVENGIVKSSDNIAIIVEDEVKNFYFFDDQQYYIVCEGYDAGEMTVVLRNYDVDGNIQRLTNYNNITVTSGSEHIINIDIKNQEILEPVMKDDRNNTILPDYDSARLTGNTGNVEVMNGYISDGDNICFDRTGYAGEIVSITAVVPDGYVFTGWTSSNSEVKFENMNDITTNFIMVNDDVVINAILIPVSSTYTITFDGNGGYTTQTTVTTNNDGRVSILPNAVRDGYMFDGWYTDPVNGTKVTTSTVFTSNTTVYAHWTIESSTYTVTYTDGVDGEEVFADQTFDVEKGSSTPAFIGTPTRSGYTFTGWNPAVSATVTDNQVYTATWVADAPIKYAVTVNGSYTSITGAGEYETGAAVTISAGTRSGYTFAGWTSSDVNITDKYSNTTTFTMPATDVTVTANWTKDSTGGVIIPTEFSINIKDSDNGKVEASVKYAVPGSTVKLTVTPDEGYELDTLSVKSDRKEIDVTEKNGKYQFTMPYGSVNVTATFKAVNPYNDVDTDDWFYDDVLLVTAKELMEGTGNSKFSPDISADRAMIVTILWRQEGCPVVDSPVDFDDVADGLWYSEAIDWASSNGIVNGYGDGNYGPTNQITREQIMAILNRYAVYKNWTDDIALPMIPQYNCSTWAENNVIWADMSGLLNGLGVDITDMTAKASRAELAAYLSRFVQNVVK